MPLDLRAAFKDEKADAVEQAIKDEVSKAIAIDSPFKVGKSYLIRTVTMVDVGKVSKITKNFLVLKDASWIADTGRFSECLTKPNAFNEVEPFKEEIYVNLDSIIDATPWPYELPRSAK